MIIDNLNTLPTPVQSTDEIPVERGTSTYKMTMDMLATALLAGMQIVPVTITGIMLPDGTSSQTNTILDLSSFVPSGKSIHTISNIKFGIYPLPYVSNGNVLTYVADLSNDNKLTIVNKSTAWNNYTLRCVLFCI